MKTSRPNVSQKKYWPLNAELKSSVSFLLAKQRVSIIKSKILSGVWFNLRMQAEHQDTNAHFDT